jgi:hypothetical protein
VHVKMIFVNIKMIFVHIKMIFGVKKVIFGGLFKLKGHKIDILENWNSNFDCFLVILMG